MEIKEENLRNAYQEGCPDVKRVLKNLFPTFHFAKNISVGDTVGIRDFSYTLDSRGNHYNTYNHPEYEYTVLAFGNYPADQYKSKNDTCICRKDNSSIVIYIQKEFLYSK